MWLEPPIEDPISIQIVGVEHSKSPRRTSPGHPVRLYGHREADVAKRLVGVEVACTIGTTIVNYFTEHNEFPMIEVSNKKWFYVAVLGKDEGLFKQEE